MAENTKPSEKKGPEFLKKEMASYILLGLSFLVFLAGLFIWSVILWLSVILIILGIAGIIWAFMKLKRASEPIGKNIPCPVCGHVYKLPEGVRTYECPLCKRKVVVERDRAYELPE
ncbi:MAG: hypothetical protein J7M18_02735 [Candidatus Eremiobacteraeota bacterium]|nr:hypothetical protein [Candidatus Eremiobacteraeota bacterium]